MTHWKTAIIRTSCSQDRGTQPSIMGVRGPMIVSMKKFFYHILLGNMKRGSSNLGRV